MPELTEAHLLTVESRLSETLEAFVVLRTIAEACNKKADQNLNDILIKHGGFWEAVLASLQTTYFVGINALLDKRKNCASFYMVLDNLKAQLPSELHANLTSSLDVIRDRYKQYRDKLFGHNDINRSTFIANLNKAEFTWESQSEDFLELEYVFGVLTEVFHKRQIPSKEQAKGMRQFHYIPCVERAANDTRSLLGKLSSTYGNNHPRGKTKPI